VQDTYCQGFGGVPQFFKVPQEWGTQGVEGYLGNTFEIKGAKIELGSLVRTTIA
jgi:hypothetical protein